VLIFSLVVITYLKTPKKLEENFSHFPIIRPANFPEDSVGTGYQVIEVGVYKILIINLMGRVFRHETLSEPFKALDTILNEHDLSTLHAVIVDFHAEATAEKKSLGHYADGRASLVVGTHTHVQTSDDYIMPKGTGYITDLGMVGIQHSSLGMDFENIVKNFLSDSTLPKIIHDHGHCIVNGIFAKIDVETRKTISIERIAEEVEV